MGFLATLLSHQHSVEDDSIAAVEKPEKKRGFWHRKKAPQKAPKLSLFLAQDDEVSVRTGSLTASLASGSRASLSTKSSSARSRMSVSFKSLELEHVPKRSEYSNEIQQEEDDHKDLIRHPSKTLKIYSKNELAENEQNATSSWKLSRNSKKERKKHRKEKKSKKRKNQQVKLPNDKLSSLDGPILSIRLEEKQPVLRKRSSSISSLDSEESAQDLKIKSIPLKSYRSKERLATNDNESHIALVAQDTDEDSIAGKGIPLTIFRSKNRQNEAPIHHSVEEKIENDLSVTSDPNESLASFPLLSSISSVSSTAKKLMDDDSLVRKSMVNDYSVPYQVSTERSSPIRKGFDNVLSISTPSSPTSTAVPNIENDDDNFSDDLLQSMLDEVSKDMEELQSLFAKNKTISSLDTGTVDQNETHSSVANFANEQSSQCSTASFDLDEFAEDDFDDPAPCNRGGNFTISAILEKDENGSEDDPNSLRADIESSRSVESDLTSTSASKVSLTGSLISFVTEDREEETEHNANDDSTSASDPSTPSRGLSKSISWKMGKPEVHLFHPYTDKSYNIDSALNLVCSFDPRCDKRKRGPDGTTASCKRPVSILRSNSGREIYPNSQEKENLSVPPVTKQKTSKSSDVSLSGSVTSSTSMLSEASESVCRMLDRLRDETERRRARIRQRREFKQ
jgi:hypothetical protein